MLFDARSPARLFLVVTIAWVALSADAWARGISADLPVEQRLSPKDDVLVEFRRVSSGEDDYRVEVWLVDPKGGEQGKLLYSYNRSVSILFSPNEEWLVVNDDAGSSESEVFLFQRTSSLEYKRATLDLNKALWTFFFRENKEKYDPDHPGLDHNYVYSVLWSDNSDAILFAIHGHSGDVLWSNSWFCVYDLRKKIATLDLQVLNRNAVGGKDRENGPSPLTVKEAEKMWASPASTADRPNTGVEKGEDKKGEEGRNR